MPIDESHRFHVPIRPTWLCATCEDEWPCAPAREALLDQTNGEGIGLLIYLASQLMDAMEDLGDAATFERFLMWARGREARPKWTRTAPLMASSRERRDVPIDVGSRWWR